MANQVVNLLHFRSLNLGEVPVNMEFGQLAVNTFNGIYPVEPTLHDVSLFIGTGGDARVDEDGTDRTADVLIASVRTGEALQSGKGWVRYQMRKLRASGDTMVGDLLMSGASIRFTPGTSGNAELVLPTDTTANVGEVGSLRFSTLTNNAQVYNGAEWVDLKSGNDFQVAATAPAVRSLGDDLVVGDFYYNTALNSLFVRVAGAWTSSSNSRDFQLSTVAPVTKSDGITPLTAGDQYYDNTGPSLYFYDGASWVSFASLV